MNPFLTITIGVHTCSRIERWKRHTGEFDDDGYPIEEVFREPTEDDLKLAERSEAGFVRQFKACMLLSAQPNAEQMSIMSSTFDVEEPVGVRGAMRELVDNVHNIVIDKVLDHIQQHGCPEAIPEGKGFAWTEIANLNTLS